MVPFQSMHGCRCRLLHRCVCLIHAHCVSSHLIFSPATISLQLTSHRRCWAMSMGKASALFNWNVLFPHFSSRRCFERQSKFRRQSCNSLWNSYWAAPLWLACRRRRAQKDVYVVPSSHSVFIDVCLVIRRCRTHDHHCCNFWPSLVRKRTVCQNHWCFSRLANNCEFETCQRFPVLFDRPLPRWV